MMTLKIKGVYSRIVFFLLYKVIYFCFTTSLKKLFKQAEDKNDAFVDFLDFQPKNTSLQTFSHVRGGLKKSPGKPIDILTRGAL